MTRVDLTPVDLLTGAIDALIDPGWTAADPSNLNQFALTGREILLVRNTDTNPHSVTLTSIDDPYGRAEDVVVSALAAGQCKVFGVIPKIGWLQAGNKFFLQANHATIQFAVLVLPTHIV